MPLKQADLPRRTFVVDVVSATVSATVGSVVGSVVGNLISSPLPGPAVAPVNHHRVDASRASVTWRTTQPSVTHTIADLPIAGGAVRV